jgi:alkylation response protein AidB-like acyl-CoA dehydrogenase
MNFEQSSEHKMLADSLDRFLSENYSFETRMSIVQRGDGFSLDIWTKLVEIGALAALFPEEAGGFGGRGFDIATVFESLGRKLVVEPIMGTMMVGRAIEAVKNEAHRSLLASLMEGDLIAALAHDESGEPVAPQQVTVSAEHSADGWLIQGRKAVVPYAAVANVLLVSAMTLDGVALILVPSNSPGLSTLPYSVIDGGCAADVIFDRVVVPRDALLAGPGLADSLLEQIQGLGLVALCAEALGAMDVAIRDTIQYLQTRRQFGTELSNFQALQHRVADLVIEIEQVRSAVINAAASLDQLRIPRERALSSAKFTVGRVGARVAEECIQLHGGIGMSWELPLAHYAKRLVMIDHQHGDQDFHLARFMALNGAESACLSRCSRRGRE